MSVQTQASRTAEFLLSEGSGEISRDIITIKEGENLKAGTVIGKLAVGGMCVQLDPSADPADGSETPFGILFDAVDATGGDQKAVAIVRLAEVSEELLVFADGVSAGDKADAIAALADLNIIAR